MKKLLDILLVLAEVLLWDDEEAMRIVGNVT